MFVAKNRKGDLISVLYRNRKDLENLSALGPFYCPSCQEEVKLKLGAVKIPHFAHISSCMSKPEGESYHHLKGKVIIYDWLIANNLTPEVEVFIPTINQRADLLVNWKSKKVAVEFQCSIIPVKELELRTKQYVRVGFIPFWIINDSMIKYKSKNVLELSDFLSFFIHDYINQSFIVSLNTETNTFNVYTNIMPFSKKRAYFDKQSFTFTESFLSIFLKPKLPTNHYNPWIQSSENWLLNLPVSPQARKNDFLHFLYSHHIHPLNLPPEVGVPLPNIHLLSTPPIVWQAYLWIQFLYKRREGESFTLNEITSFLFERMQGRIVWRSLPNNRKVDYLSPVVTYFNFLEFIGIIRKVNDKYMIKKRAILIDKPSKEREIIRQDFFRRYKGIIIQTFRLTD